MADETVFVPGVVQLYPTKTRLKLLAEVDAGQVTIDIDDQGEEVVWLRAWAVDRRRVSARVWELYRASWVEIGPGSPLWRLTDVGRKVLEARRG